MSNPPEDQILFAIGHLADSFARLEFTIVDCLSNLVNNNDFKIGEIICNRLSLIQTVSLISDLLNYNYSKKTCKEFKNLSKKIQEAASLRNDILHSTWATPSADDDTDCEIIQERARKRHITPKYHEIDDLLEKLEKGTFTIQDIEMGLHNFLRKFIKNPIQHVASPDHE